MIVVYDVTNGESFANVKRWLHEIEQNCDVVNRVLGKYDIRFFQYFINTINVMAPSETVVLCITSVSGEVQP